MNDPLKYTDPSGSLSVPTSFNDSGYDFNTEAADYLENNSSEFNNLSGGSFSGGSDNYLGADWDKWMNWVRNGNEGTMEEFYSGKKKRIVSLGFGFPTIEFTILTNPEGYKRGEKVEITIRIFGTMYSKYNFVQSVYFDFDEKSSFKYQIDPVCKPNNGFYYTEIQLKEYSSPFFRKGSNGFFRDAPNPENGFHAEWTLCGLKGESWYAIKTFSWGYLIFNGGQVSPYFQNSSNYIPEHQNNVVNAINYHDMNP